MTINNHDEENSGNTGTTPLRDDIGVTTSSEEFGSERSYKPSDLEAFNLLQHPVWVFDIEKKVMFWANTSALELWNADSLTELLERDFSQGLSETIDRRMKDQLIRLKRGERLHEQWTSYPKGQPKTLALAASPLCIDGGRIAALCETELLSNTDFKNASVRGVEMLRHLPIAVSQFDIEGKVAFQNPEAMALFGGAEEETKEERNDTSMSHFLGRFVDRRLGKDTLERVQQGNDCNVEAELYTKGGAPKCFSIAARKASDPVTSKPIILYSARDISEIIQARKDTKKASSQSDFMVAISHELQTPLHQIVGYMDLLQPTEMSPTQSEAVRMAQDASASLASFIRDILDFSILENGKLQLETILFDPSVVVNDCVAAVGGEAKLKGLALQNIQLDLPDRLLGDPHRLRQILLNLLGNAVKFTEQGTVTIKTTKAVSADAKKGPSEDRILFEITDTGIGVHPDNHNRIFEKYEQGDSSIWRNYGGTGLGLTICKSLIERMRGEISLQSERGKGTTFVIEIPFEAPKMSSKKRPKLSNQRRHVGTGSLRILVVEDNYINQKMVRKMLERMGHTVTLVDHGKAAVDEIKRISSYALVLMDVQMPILNGIDATRQIRGILGLDKSTLPVVGLTATFEPSQMRFYQEIGMNHCVGKPATMKTLKEVIDSYALSECCTESCHVSTAQDSGVKDSG